MVVVTNNMIFMARDAARAGPPADLRDSKEEAAYLALLRTAYGLEEAVGGLLKPHRLSPTQYNALRILRGAGAEGLPCSEVGARMINRDPDITRLMDRLEKRGFVRRSRGKADRRVIRASITSTGLNLLQRLDRPVSDGVRHLMGRLGLQQIERLMGLLQDIQRQG